MNKLLVPNTVTFASLYTTLTCNTFNPDDWDHPVSGGARGWEWGWGKGPIAPLLLHRRFVLYSWFRQLKVGPVTPLLQVQLSTKYLVHSKTHKRVVRHYARQQQHAYTRKQTNAIINGRGKATPIQLAMMHPPFKFSKSATAVVCQVTHQSSVHYNFFKVI